MRIPIFSSYNKKKSLERRKGGGGGGKGGGSSGAKGGGSTGSGSSGRTPVSGLPTSGNRGASPYGSGGGSPITIPAGTLFAGRTSGGGTRNQVFGNRLYGSGYPGQGSRSVSGRGFPFGYWPLVWGAGVGAGIGYLHDSEYGRGDNSSRPGGVLFQAIIMEPNDNTTYHLVADNSSVTSILSSVESNCTLLTNSITPRAINPDNSSEPQPEQAVQYYRASSVALTLDGYNNSAVDSSNDTAVDTPLPSGLNMTFLDCLNQTIGASAPILDASAAVPRFLNPIDQPLALPMLWLFIFLARTLF